MTKELLQQALDALELQPRVLTIDNNAYPHTVARDEVIHKLKQALAQQEQCGCREGECETKKDKTCRMTIEIAERDGIPEWTPAIGIECAISNLRDDAARLRDGSYTPLQIADDLDVIANDLTQCKPVSQQEQPASVDAYNGAREDVAIWKKRALEAEELNRKFIAELNGPTYLGEPVKQEQPAQEPFKWYDGAPPFPQNQESFIAQTICGERVVLRVLPEEYTYDYTTADGTYMKAENIKKWMQFPDCEFLPPEPAPTQPALSDLIELAKVYSQQYANPHHIVFSVDGLRHLIEAHLKGQK